MAPAFAVGLLVATVLYVATKAESWLTLGATILIPYPLALLVSVVAFAALPKPRMRQDQVGLMLAMTSMAVAFGFLMLLGMAPEGA